MTALTGTQRAAMRLALGLARRDVLDGPGWSPWASDLAAMLEVLARGGIDVPAWDGVGKRRWRARLALYLRARLRAERGDYGPTEWHGRSCFCDGERDGWMPRRIVPLWELAGATGGRDA